MFVVDVHPACAQADGTCVQALSQQLLHAFDFLRAGAALTRRISHHPQAQHAVAGQRGHIDTQVISKGGEVLCEGLPVPLHAGVKRGCGHFLDLAEHGAHESAVLGAHRRHGQRTVAVDHRGNAMLQGGRG